MLKRNKKNENDKPFASAGSAEMKNTTPLPTSTARDAKTVIGEHISIEGSITGEETLEIEGSMKGSIELKKHDFIFEIELFIPFGREGNKSSWK